MTLAQGPMQVTCSVGFCHLETTRASPAARCSSPLRSPGMRRRASGPGRSAVIPPISPAPGYDRDALRRVRSAVERVVVPGSNRSFPQTAVRGVEIEALARWHHPDRGCLAPGVFLPAIEGTDLMELLGQTMLTQSLAATAEFDRKGLRVPTVAVNFSPQELQDPQLPERAGRWTASSLRPPG